MYDLQFNSGNCAPFRIDLYSWQEGVTGSCTLLAITFSDGRKCHGLIDCGIIQDLKGEDLEKNLDFHFEPKILDFIVITHVHADHIGRLPILYKNGCKAKIYVSEMTDELLKLALPDAEKIMSLNCEQRNQKKWYTKDDVQKVLDNTISVPYFNQIAIGKEKSISIMLIDNGHVLGASSVFVKVKDKYSKCPIVYFFSGDYKPENKLTNIIGISNVKKQFDLKNTPINIVIESTYGQSTRTKKREQDKQENKFLHELYLGITENKTIFIPTLSLERPILELYELKKAQEQGILPLDIPIYVAGKLILQFLKVYEDVVKFDYKPMNLHFIDNVTTLTVTGQKKLIPELKRNKKPKIVIASSGMCNYGAAISILQEYLPKKNVKILFTSYLAEGTLGQKIRDSKLGEMLCVNGVMLQRCAEISETSQFSGHATPDELIDLMRNFGKIKFVAINHGDCIAKKDFSKRVHKEFPNARIVTFGDGYFFRTNCWGLIQSKPIPKKYKQ